MKKPIRSFVAVAFTFMVIIIIPAQGQENGIAVGAPKVFDNRSLTLMLDQLDQSLRPVQVIDQKSLIQALSSFQGAEQEDVSRAFSISTLPLPSVKTNLDTDTSGKTSTKQEINQAAFSPSAPQLPDALAAPKFQPQYGVSASDLLSDQLNLSYQITNIRMLLERSLSDRLWPSGGPAEARLQVVLGFEISLDPPKEAKDSAAQVEITLSPADGANSIDLVAMMPLEKTYNSSALSSRSNAFGGSAVVKLITVGYSERRRGQTFYLFRDNDTVALQRMENPKGSADKAITFGWQFRPVLGRKSVSPGVRQMFAVVSLPAQDLPNSVAAFPVNVRVRTYWTDYSHKNLTTTGSRGAWSRLWNGSLPRVRDHTYPAININPTSTIQNNLKAQVTAVQWAATDDKSAVVLVSGKNFFHGTTINMGANVVTEANGGLVLKSDQAMQVNATLSTIGTAEAVINSRYGPSTFLRMPPPFAAVFIHGLALHPLGDQFYSLSLYLAKTEMGPHPPLHVVDLPHDDPPVVLINNTVYPKPYQLYDAATPEGDEVILQTIVPAAVIQSKNAILTVKFPFMGDGWSPSRAMYDPCSFSASRIGGASTTTLVITGVRDCGSNWRVLLDKTYELSPAGPLRHPSQNVLTFEVSTELLSKYKKLIVYADNSLPGQPYSASGVLSTNVLDIPAGTAAPADPKLDVKAPAQIVQFEARGITYTGSGLSAIKKVEFNGQVLQFSVKKDGKSITIYLTPAVTAKPGLDEVLLKTDDGTIIPAQLLVSAAPSKTVKKP